MIDALGRDAVGFQRQFAPRVGAAQAHLAVVEIEGDGAGLRQVGGVAGKFDLFRQARVGGDLEQAGTGGVDAQAGAAHRVGEGGPADLGAVAGLLRIDVAVEQAHDDAGMHGAPSAGVAIGIIFLGAFAEPGPELALRVDLGLHADARQHRQLAVGPERAIHRDLAGTGDPVAEGGAAVAGWYREIGGDHHVVAVLAGGDAGGGGVLAGLAPDFKLSREVGAAVVVGGWPPEVEVQRGCEELLVLAGEGHQRAAVAVDRGGDVAGGDGDALVGLGEGGRRGGFVQGGRGAGAPRQGQFIPRDGHAFGVPGGVVGQVVAQAQDIFRVWIGHAVGGDAEAGGLLRGDDRQCEVALAQLDAILEEFPRAVQVVAGPEESFIAHLDGHRRRVASGDAAVNFLINFFHFLELWRRLQRGQHDAVATERFLRRAIAEIPAIGEKRADQRLGGRGHAIELQHCIGQRLAGLFRGEGPRANGGTADRAVEAATGFIGVEAHRYLIGVGVHRAAQRAAGDLGAIDGDGDVRAIVDAGDGVERLAPILRQRCGDRLADPFGLDGKLDHGSIGRDVERVGGAALGEDGEAAGAIAVVVAAG